MSKEDKQFFTSLFKRLENQVGRNYAVIQENSNLIKKNSNGIRHNGVLIEKMHDDIDLLAESNSVFHDRVSRLESTVC